MKLSKLVVLNTASTDALCRTCRPALLMVALACSTAAGFLSVWFCLCAHAYEAYPYPPPTYPVYGPEQSYSTTPFQGSNVESNPYIYAGEASPGGYPGTSSGPPVRFAPGTYLTPRSSLLVPVPQPSVPPQSYSTTPFQPSNVEANPYIYAGNAGANGQQETTLRNPLIPGAQSTAPDTAAAPGQPPPIGNGPIPAAVTPGMGGVPFTPNSNAFGQVSNVNAMTETGVPPNKSNNTIPLQYQTNVTGMIGAPLVIPPANALNSNAVVTGAVAPYLQAPASTPGTLPVGPNGNTSGLIYPKQYTNATYNTGSVFMPPAAVGTVGANGGITVTGTVPTKKWSGAQAQTTHDYGLSTTGHATVMNGKQTSEYYNTDFGQALPAVLQSTGSPAANALNMTQDGARPTAYLNWQAADSSTEQSAATTPSDYTADVVPRNANLPGQAPNTTWNLFGHRQNFRFQPANGVGNYTVPHNSSNTTTGSAVPAVQTTAYY